MMVPPSGWSTGDQYTEYGWGRGGDLNKMPDDFLNYLYVVKSGELHRARVAFYDTEKDGGGRPLASPFAQYYQKEDAVPAGEAARMLGLELADGVAIPVRKKTAMYIALAVALVLLLALLSALFFASGTSYWTLLGLGVGTVVAMVVAGISLYLS